MQSVLRTDGVITFDRRDFEAACADLMTLVRGQDEPALLIGVRTGGLHVAEAMARASGATVPVLPITSRRPSTRYKNVTAPARKLIATLPRAVLDRLRVMEHKFLTRKPQTGRPARAIDQGELDAFEQWVSRAGPEPTVVVVDDAVDTGATLGHVLDAIQARMPSGGILRAAALTVTTLYPAVMPDYVLLRQKLCRFPWSLDAGLARSC